MEIQDKYIIVLALLLLVVSGYSLINIFKFMPVVNQCADSFKIINLCHCVPDANLAKLFNIKDSYFINYSFNLTK
jgi:hypothetical protein